MCARACIRLGMQNICSFHLVDILSSYIPVPHIFTCSHNPIYQRLSSKSIQGKRTGHMFNVITFPLLCNIMIGYPLVSNHVRIPQCQEQYIYTEMQ
jgi:hypothetical protein